MNRRRRFLSERNRTLASWIFRPAPAAIWIMALNWILMAIEGIVLSVLSKDPTILKVVHVDSQAAALACLRPARKLRARLEGRNPGMGRRALAGQVIVPAKLRMLLKYGLPGC